MPLPHCITYGGLSRPPKDFESPLRVPNGHSDCSSCRTRSEFAPLPHRSASRMPQIPNPPTARRYRVPIRPSHLSALDDSGAFNALSEQRLVRQRRKESTRTRVALPRSASKAVHISGHLAQGGSGPCHCMRHGATPRTSTRPCRPQPERPRLQDHRLDRPRLRLYLRILCARIQRPRPSSSTLLLRPASRSWR
ncbi:hypothetical protein C8Q76DRAFT_133374 [Earliella scabrosa]|nr:hypothetical protein C8Q76DRAFT_133374 [Earliella scabrosa]